MPAFLGELVERGVVVYPAVDLVQVAMFGDTDIPTASQSGIVNETLGRSGIHDAVGVVRHNEAHIYRICRFPFPAINKDKTASNL